MKFDRSEVLAALGPVEDGEEREIVIEGLMTDGTPFEGTDCMIIIHHGHGRVGMQASVQIGGSCGVSEIHYTLCGSAPVNLAIYDLNGRRIRQLVKDQLPAGDHSVLWDGRDDAGEALAPGIYFYRLETPGSLWTKKAILVR